MMNTAIDSVDVLIGQSTYADIVLKGFSKAIGIRYTGSISHAGLYRLWGQPK
ncbi:MAG: hypothetical protein ACLT16_20495 [[Clostridium] innocuum]